MALYAAGFPCTPYSLLHWQSSLLEDDNVRQLWKILKNIVERQPAVTWLDYMSCFANCLQCAVASVSPQVALLENVLGFKRCWEIVKAEIEKQLPKYLVGH